MPIELIQEKKKKEESSFKRALKFNTLKYLIYLKRMDKKI